MVKKEFLRRFWCKKGGFAEARGQGADRAALGSEELLLTYF